EVRPSTVKTWLTIRREPTRVDRSSSRVNAAQRVRTPCATYTLARMTTHTHPSRPCREMQSDSLRRSAKQPQPRSRAPPRSRTSINIAPGLTGNSVEIVRRHGPHPDPPPPCCQEAPPRELGTTPSRDPC